MRLCRGCLCVLVCVGMCWFVLVCVGMVMWCGGVVLVFVLLVCVCVSVIVNALSVVRCAKTKCDICDGSKKRYL